MPVALISNDDGIWAPGIRALCSAAADAGYQVYVCAPDRERSAISHGLTMGIPLRVEHVRVPGTVHAWSTTGTPADCLKIALEVLMPSRPDVVLSGVNKGPNLGTDVLYSGTVAAAMEGAVAGIPSVAVSTADYEPTDYSLAASAGVEVARVALERGLPRGLLLNVNVPDGADSTRWTVTRLGVQRYSNVFDKRRDPRGKEYYWLCGVPEFDMAGEGDLDTAAVRRQEVSVTPLRSDFTDVQAMALIRAWDVDTT
ncbi:MAG: 5'-nucleotidase SurE [Firmicutes bacterium ADurb.Bin506]|jgi:5'-nucleotidase|nr:MAG: 5'-nucleotidase SurE [Firmicutes bacterium ADurb.Bin506]